MRFGLMTVGVNIVLGVTLFQVMGVAGIAAATATAWWLNVIMMAVSLHRRDHYSPSPRAVSKLIRILAASVAMGAILGTASYFRGPIERALGHFAFGPLHGKELAIALVVGLAGASYPFLLFAFGGLTMTEIRAAFRRRRGQPVVPTPDLS